MAGERRVQVAVVGAGFGGIATAIGLRRELRTDDFVVFERAADLGGVWRDNVYPGAACDVPSYLYSFSYAQRRDWTRPCSPRREIHDYLRATVRAQGVADRIETGTEVRSAAYDERAARWRIETGRGERLTASALVLACGQLSRPRLPDIPGREDFAGPAFHSARWDHDVDLAGRRVAVIGTGASAIQLIPEIAQRAARVDVYQRTPPWILPRRNRPYGRFTRALIRHLPGVQAARRRAMLAFMESGIAGQTRVPLLRELIHAWSAIHMRLQVRDPELRERIRPDYPIGCKRVLFSSSYLPALQRANVELVTDRIARIGEHGPVTEDGRERPVDCIVYGTGFETHAFVAPMEVRGRQGRTLADAWAGGAEAHLGIEVAGFPNLFLVYGPNTNLGFGSIVVMIEAQVAYVLDALRTLRRAGADALEVRPEVQRASTEEVQRRLRRSVWAACDSWYREAGNGRIVNNWPGQMAEYVRMTSRVRPEEHELLRAAA